MYRHHLPRCHESVEYRRERTEREMISPFSLRHFLLPLFEMKGHEAKYFPQSAVNAQRKLHSIHKTLVTHEKVEELAGQFM